MREGVWWPLWFYESCSVLCKKISIFHYCAFSFCCVGLWNLNHVFLLRSSFGFRYLFFIHRRNQFPICLSRVWAIGRRPGPISFFLASAPPPSTDHFSPKLGLLSRSKVSIFPLVFDFCNPVRPHVWKPPPRPACSRPTRLPIDSSYFRWI
jgi:hypothetical protein